VDTYGGGVRVSFAADGIDPVPLRRLAGVAGARRLDGRIEVRGDGAFLTGVGHALTVQGHGDAELRVDRGTLEDAYVNLVHAAGVAAGRDQ
jgi:hypothetical protein